MHKTLNAHEINVRPFSNLQKEATGLDCFLLFILKSAYLHARAGSEKSTSMKLAEIARLKAQNFELKAKLKIKEAEITAL
eukprot:2668972-Pleurochrysis_carterae.AAC.2